jgi:hypothetical protein
MRQLISRVGRLEQTMRCQEPAPPWALPGWKQLSEVTRRTAAARYFAPLSDAELLALVATLKAQEGAIP